MYLKKNFSLSLTDYAVTLDLLETAQKIPVKTRLPPSTTTSM